MIKVSVIIATYNGACTIEDVIQSILNQEGLNDLFNLEIILVDDCSTDNTINCASQFDVHLMQTSVNSGGPNKGRNMGLQKSTGDYICIADQDDIWEENKIISLLPFCKKADIVTSGYTVLDGKRGKEIRRVQTSKEGYIYWPKNEAFISILTKSLNGQNTYLGSIIFHKALKGILFEEVFGMVDFDWLLRLFYQRDSVEVCKSLYRRKVSGENLSLDPAYRKRDFYYSLFTIEEFCKEFPRQAHKSYLRIHGSRARYYYLMGDMKKARFYFRKSALNWKTTLYYLTTYFGHSLVRKKFNVFG